MTDMAETKTVRVKTTGMHCQSCVMLVKMNLEDIEGVRSVKVDLAAGMSEVGYDPDLVTVDGVVAAIESAGYGAAVAE